MKNILLFACLSLLFNSCKKDKTPAKVIGEKYQGGIIFYVDATGHGLIAAETDLDPTIGYKWGCTGTEVLGAVAEEVGLGRTNTAAILTECNLVTDGAANMCKGLTLGGYQDWFLPSRNELNLIYKNLFLKDIGGFGEAACYWSSTQYDKDYAWVQIFTKTGPLQKQVIQLKSNTKFNDPATGSLLRVRAVRVF